MTDRIMPHRTRVVVDGRGAGMVVRVENAARQLRGSGSHVDVPARIHVVLDAGGRAIVSPDRVTVEEEAA